MWKAQEDSQIWRKCRLSVVYQAPPALQAPPAPQPVVSAPMGQALSGPLDLPERTGTVAYQGPLVHLADLEPQDPVAERREKLVI